MSKTIELQEFHSKVSEKLNGLLVPVDQEFIDNHPYLDMSLLHPLNDGHALRYTDLIQYIMAQEAVRAMEPATMHSVATENPIACISCMIKAQVKLNEDTEPLSFEQCVRNIENAVIEEADSQPSLRTRLEGRELIRMLCKAGINAVVAQQAVRDITGFARDTKQELLGVGIPG